MHMFYFHNKCYEHYTLSYSFFHHMVAKEPFMYMLSSPYHSLIKKEQSKTYSLPLSSSKKFNNENGITFIYMQNTLTKCIYNKDNLK